jgi:hypothetical protein
MEVAEGGRARDARVEEPRGREGEQSERSEARGTGWDGEAVERADKMSAPIESLYDAHPEPSDVRIIAFLFSLSMGLTDNVLLCSI